MGVNSFTHGGRCEWMCTPGFNIRDVSVSGSNDAMILVSGLENQTGIDLSYESGMSKKASYPDWGLSWNNMIYQTAITNGTGWHDIHAWGPFGGKGFTGTAFAYFHFKGRERSGHRTAWEVITVKYNVKDGRVV